MFMAAVKSSCVDPPYLPEDIIFHIFSIYSNNLTNQEAIQLSLVSKMFFGVVQNRSTLIFNQPSHYRYHREELNYIVSTLTRYRRENIVLETFILKAVLQTPHDDQLYHQCIELAAKKGLKTLHIRFKCPPPRHFLPQAVFEVESLVELELTCCRLKPRRVVAWPNLKRLSINHGCVAEEEEVLESMIMGCSPSIENLKVDSHDLPKSFNAKIANLKNLKHLNMSMLGKNQRLEVDGSTTPNLESIVCFSSSAIDLGAAEYPNLKSLELTTCGAIYQHLFTNFASRFPILENLSLKYIWVREGMQRYSLSSTSLKKLKMNMHNSSPEVYFDVPNLVRFKCHNSCTDTFPKLSFAAGNSGAWSSCTELNEWKKRLDASWFLGLYKYLAALNESETSISVKFVQGIDLVDDAAHQIIANSVIPIRGIKEFSLRSSSRELTQSCASSILDCIVSICRPRIITLMDCKSYDLPRIIHEKLASRTCQDHGRVIDFEMVEADKNPFKDTVSISFHLKYYS